MKLIIWAALASVFLLLPAGAEEVIKEFSGTDTFSTKPFTVPDNWEIQWESKGQYLQILVNTENSIPLGFVADQMGPGAGSSVQPKGGTYYLYMNASGDWKVKILKGK
jgi:hypothetical protein